MVEAFVIFMAMAKEYGISSAVLVISIVILLIVHKIYKQNKKHREKADGNNQELVKAQLAAVQNVNNLIEKSLRKLSSEIAKEISNQGERHQLHADTLDEAVQLINDLNKELAELRGMFGASLMIGHKGVK